MAALTTARRPPPGSAKLAGATATNRSPLYQVTAWASREPDAGPEWLSVAFPRAVEIAEVRVRESYNPGAIVRVAALVNNQEIVLWDGEAAGGRAPRDFVVRPTTSVQAQVVIIHLDSASVPGWNEIDAVELVGRDGSRQWAASASASSTYAERLSTASGSGASFLRF